VGRAEKITKECWQEKQYYKWYDRCGRKREKYYITNGWETEVEEIRNRNRVSKCK